MADRDKDFYRALVLSANTDLGIDKEDDPLDDAAILRLISTLAKLDQGDDNALSDDPDYDPLSDEEYDDLIGDEAADLIGDAVAVAGKRRHEKKRESDGDADSTGGDADDSDDGGLIPSDEGEKEVDTEGGAPEREKGDSKGGGCVSDKEVKKARGRRLQPSEEDLTRMNVASALADLRF